MHQEMMALLRLNTIALMAATLEAGDRARSDVPHGDCRLESDAVYARGAIKLYEAVENLEYPDPLAATPSETRGE